MAKNLSEKVRAICGLRSPGGGQLPPTARRSDDRAITGETREQQRRDRLRELAKRMKRAVAADH